MYRDNERIANEVLSYLIDDKYGKHVYVHHIRWHGDGRDNVEVVLSPIHQGHVDPEKRTILVKVKPRKHDESCHSFSILSEITWHLREEDVR